MRAFRERYEFVSDLMVCLAVPALSVERSESGTTTLKRVVAANRPRPTAERDHRASKTMIPAIRFPTRAMRGTSEPASRGAMMRGLRTVTVSPR